jgi:hypothetical protein
VNEWRLLIYSSKRSLKAVICTTATTMLHYLSATQCTLKAVLLHNGNNYASLPIGHSVHLKESYENLELAVTMIGYTAHDWMICGGVEHASRSVGWSYQVNGTAEQEVNTGSKNTGHQGQLLNLGARTFCAKILSIRRKYCCHTFILN